MQWRLRIFTLNLSFPLVKEFPVLMIHTWIGVSVTSFTAKGKSLGKCTEIY